MHDLWMFLKPIDSPNNSILLKPHCKYYIKIHGNCIAIQLCDSSKIVAPMLIEFTLAYSSCVEHPVQRLLIFIADHLDLCIYGGDASDAFAHIPVPSVPKFVSIDNQFADWYRHKFGNNIDREKVLHVLRSLQGNPGSGRLLESPINQILKIMGFYTTTHDKDISKSLLEKLSIF